MKNTIGLLIVMLLIACGGDEKKANEKQAIEVTTPSNAGAETGVDPVLNEINKRLRSDVNNKDLYLERAKYFLANNEIERSAGDITRAFQIDSVYLPTLLLQANFLTRNGQLELSEFFLQKADRLYPENSEVQIGFSELYLIGKENTKSIKYADLAIKYDLFNAKAYYLKGYNFLEVGDTTKSISSYQTAIEQDPDYFKAYLELGYIFSQKDDPLALDYYKNALEVKPGDKNALYSKGMFEQEHEMYNEAMATYTEAIKLHPNFREAHYNLGYVHLFYLKLYSESKRYFSDAIKVDPRYKEAYYNRGYAFELLGDIGNAKIDYQNALNIDPTYDLAAQGMERVSKGIL